MNEKIIIKEILVNAKSKLRKSIIIALSFAIIVGTVATATDKNQILYGTENQYLLDLSKTEIYNLIGDINDIEYLSVAYGAAIDAIVKSDLMLEKVNSENNYEITQEEFEAMVSTSIDPLVTTLGVGVMDIDKERCSNVKISIQNNINGLLEEVLNITVETLINQEAPTNIVNSVNETDLNNISEVIGEGLEEATMTELIFKWIQYAILTFALTFIGWMLIYTVLFLYKQENYGDK